MTIMHATSRFTTQEERTMTPLMPHEKLALKALVWAMVTVVALVTILAFQVAT